MKRYLSLLLALLLALSLCACGAPAAQDDAPAQDAASNADAAPAEDNDADAASDTEAFTGMDVNFAVLAGPTGIGAVDLMEASDAGETVNHYNTTVAAANDDIVAGLTNGDFDIAAVATNVAANLYNKTSGAVQICALNTYGVLYILENGDSIQSVSDLAGKTIYATGQGANPEYVLKYIMEQNGLHAVYPSDELDSSAAPSGDEDYTVEFLDSETLVAGMAGGEYEVCMLPVPAVTSVMMQNSDVRIALDLTEEWNAASDGKGALTMGSIVVRTEFAEAHPEAVAAFLTEYAASIDAVQADVEHAAQLCETYGIVPKAAVAAKAIPDCSLCCITGTDIQTTIEPYYQVLFDANPNAIGGALPGEDFYFVGQ